MELKAGQPGWQRGTGWARNSSALSRKAGPALLLLPCMHPRPWRLDSRPPFHRNGTLGSLGARSCHTRSLHHHVQLRPGEGSPQPAELKTHPPVHLERFKWDAHTRYLPSPHPSTLTAPYLPSSHLSTPFNALFNVAAAFHCAWMPTYPSAYPEYPYPNSTHTPRSTLFPHQRSRSRMGPWTLVPWARGLGRWFVVR